MKKLEGCHPELIAKTLRILTAMRALGWDMLVTDGVRTLAQQQALYAQGRTKPGRIVTYADGVRTRSNHQAGPDGLGRAVDCCFLVNNKASWDDALPWMLYGAMAMAMDLEWGGAWQGKLVDRPHIQMKSP